MKFFKWSFIGIGAVIVVFLFLSIGIKLYFNTDGAQQRIQTKVNQAIPGTITWSDSRLSIWAGEVELHNVLFRAPTNDKLFELNRLLLQVSWFRLFKGELCVNDLLLEKPQIYLATDQMGNINLIQALLTPGNNESTPKHSGFRFNVVIRQLQVHDGFFQYKTDDEVGEKQQNRMVLKNVDLTIRDGNLLKQTGRLACEIDGGYINFGDFRTTIDRLYLSANLEKNRINTLIIDVNKGGVFLEVSGDIQHPFTNNPIVDLNLKGAAVLSKIKHLIPLAHDSTGAVQASSTVQGSLNNPNINLTLNYGGGHIAGRIIDRINLNCRLKDKRLAINNLNLYASEGRFDVNGDVDFKKAFANGFIHSVPDPDAISYRLSIRQKDTLLENVASQGSRLKGSINSIIELEGTGIYPKKLAAETTLELFVKKLSTRESRSSVDVHLTAHAGMNKGRITIQQFEARAGRTHLKANGGYDLSSHEIAANFFFKAPDLTDVMSPLGMEAFLGKVMINGDVYGTVKAPQVDVRLEGKDLKFEDMKIGDAEAKILFSDGMLSLDYGKIRNHNSKLDVFGTARILDPITRNIVKSPSFDIALKGDALFVEDFLEGMKGKFILNGHVKGDMAHPRGRLNLKGENIHVYKQKIDGIQLTSNLDGDRINFDPFVAVIAPGEKIMIDGWISLDKRYHLRLASGGISLKNIARLELGEFDNGKISFNFHGKGNFDNPKIQGNVALTDLRFNNQHLKDGQFQVQIVDRTAHISGGLGFSLSANYHFQTQAFSASAGFDNTNLVPYLRIAGRKKLNGFVTGKIEISGNAAVPDQIIGSADISQLELFREKSKLLSAGDFKVFLDAGEISIPVVRLNLMEQGFMEIKGSVKLNGGLDLRADGNIPLEIITLFTDILPNATGIALLSLEMNGNLSQTNIFGHLDLKNIGMTVPGLLQSLHDLNGSIHVTSKAIVLDNIHGMLDEGRFRLSGTIDLNAYQPSKIGIKLIADDLLIMIPETLEIRLNAELDLEGTPVKSLVSGNVQIVEGTYYKDIQLNLIESLGKTSREEAPAASEIPWPFFKNMALDIKTGHREPFVVDNNMALLAVKPDLRIYGSVNHPLISGRAEVESGTVYFQKKEFNVKRGVFDFINPYKIEPTIDVQSEVMVREWTILLHVSGTPDNLKFNFSSDPSETEGDILSLLITGETTRELIAGEGGSSLSPRQMLGDILAETVQKQIKDSTGLDAVELEYNEAKEADASDEVKVTVGKDLSRRVTVRYGMKAKNAKIIQQVIAEYKFLEKVLMNTFQDTEGNFGGGLQFRLEFR
jgi:translocation and assembly module TamB